MGKASLQTAGAPAAIALSADRDHIAADGQDLAYVTVQVLDGNGVPHPLADHRLQFAVEGPAVIAGVDNGDITDTDDYTDSSRKAWHGRALVVLRSTHDAGAITLTVTAPGLPVRRLLLHSETTTAKR